MIKIRDTIFARKKRQPTNERCKCLYNLFRNRVDREIKKSKKPYYVDYFSENVNNITQCGMVFKKLLILRILQIKLGN